MHTLFLVFVLGLGGWLIYNRRRIVAGVPALRALVSSVVASRSAAQPGELGPLIAALYNSLIDKSQRTWWTRRHHVDGQYWTVTASPQDAEILGRAIPAVEADLNAALADNATRHRIVLGAPIRIDAVLADKQTAVGRPFLTASSATRGAKPVEPIAARRSARPPAADWEAPTTLAKTIGESLVSVPTGARLWPLGPGRDDPIDVPSDGIVLGRSPSLARGRLVSRTVSGRHAELRRTGEHWIVRDLGSHNGTFVGGRRVSEAEVKHGDIIGLGRHVRMRMVVGEQTNEPTVRATG